MSYENPTPLRVGMTGQIAGTPYRVAGRMVLGMEEDGETYFWNEFYLTNESGAEATLVYETTDTGGTWRLFVWFTPSQTMTAEQAAAKKVGETVTIDGRRLRVTLVDESRVYSLEGEAPEGVEVGDVARYFNAEAGTEKVVVSWTGEEVEFYRGRDLPGALVSSAFRLPPGGYQARFNGGPSSARPSGALVASIVTSLVSVGSILFVLFSCNAPVKPRLAGKIAVASAPFAAGQTGVLNGKSFRAEGHCVADVGQVGMHFERHEYSLVDESGNRALLVCGHKPNDPEWTLYSPVPAPASLSPSTAAAKRTGDTIDISGSTAVVADLFQSTANRSEGFEALDGSADPIAFGFTARSGLTPILARWTASAITVYRGTLIPAKKVTAAFVK